MRILLSLIAIPLFAQTTPLTPEQRGDLYMVRKMFREAIDTYRTNALNSAVMWDKLGIAYHQLGDLSVEMLHALRGSHFHCFKKRLSLALAFLNTFAGTQIVFQDFGDWDAAAAVLLRQKALANNVAECFRKTLADARLFVWRK